MSIFSEEHITTAYDEELSSLTNSVMEMNRNVIHLVKLSEQSLKVKEVSFIEEADNFEQRINDIDFEIDRTAVNILALRQPMAVDLRFVVSAIKIASLLERMGDRAKYIIRRAVKISSSIDPDILSEMLKMNKIILIMMDRVFNALSNYNSRDLEDAFNQDDSIDTIYRDLFKKVRESLVGANAQEVDSLCEIMTVVRNYERMGDYISKIARIIYYVKQGKKIKNFDNI